MEERKSDGWWKWRWKRRLTGLTHFFVCQRNRFNRAITSLLNCLLFTGRNKPTNIFKYTLTQYTSTAYTYLHEARFFSLTPDSSSRRSVAFSGPNCRMGRRSETPRSYDFNNQYNTATTTRRLKNIKMISYKSTQYETRTRSSRVKESHTNKVIKSPKLRDGCTCHLQL